VRCSKSTRTSPYAAPAASLEEPPPIIRATLEYTSPQAGEGARCISWLDLAGERMGLREHTRWCSSRASDAADPLSRLRYRMHNLHEPTVLQVPPPIIRATLEYTSPASGRGSPAATNASHACHLNAVGFICDDSRQPSSTTRPLSRLRGRVGLGWGGGLGWGLLAMCESDSPFAGRGRGARCRRGSAAGLYVERGANPLSGRSSTHCRSGSGSSRGRSRRRSSGLGRSRGDRTNRPVRGLAPAPIRSVPASGNRAESHSRAKAGCDAVLREPARPSSMELAGRMR
jgi:hypothetical protein